MSAAQGPGPTGRHLTYQIVRLEDGWGVHMAGDPGLHIIGFTSEASAGEWIARFIVALIANGREAGESMLMGLQSAGRIS